MKNTAILKQQEDLRQLLVRLRRLNMTIQSLSQMPNTTRDLCSRQIQEMKNLVIEMDATLDAHKTPVDVTRFLEIHEGLVTRQKIHGMNHQHNGHSAGKMSLPDVA